MEVQAITKNVSVSPQKMREVTREIHGKSAVTALVLLSVVPRKSALILAKTVRAALANAENNNRVQPKTLRVKEAVAGAAASIKRFTPKARGSAGPIIKRRCHVKVVLIDE